MTHLTTVYNQSFSTNFLITTPAYLTSGLLGAYVAHDLTWVSSGLLQASLNQICVQGGLATAKDNDLNLWTKQFLKVGLIALAIILGEQLAPLINLPINPNVATSIAAFNLITSFVLDFITYAPIKKKQIVSASPPSNNQPIIGEELTWKGELTLPKPEVFGDLKDFFKGFFCMCFTQDSRSGVSKEFEDIFYLTHFPPEMLVKKTGAFLKPPHKPINLLDAVVTECITFDSREEATTKMDKTVTQFLKCHHTLPKKLILPFGGSLHTACIVIEPQERGYSITALDSIGSSSSYGWHEITLGAKRALTSYFPSQEIKITCNNWSQNNLMQCGLHLMENFSSAVDYQGSLFDLIETGNQSGSIPEKFPLRNQDILTEIFKRIKKEISAHFEQIIKLNNGQIFLKSNQGLHLVDLPSETLN